MAWTKAKTAVFIGGVMILAIGTTTGLIIKHSHSPRGPIQESAWKFRGNATPEAAFQSALWAMSKGDVKTLSTLYTPEFMSRFMQMAGKGKSENELSALFIQIAAAIGDFEVTGKKTVSDDEVILHLPTKARSSTVPLKKFDGQWKINGNLEMDMEPANAR